MADANCCPICGDEQPPNTPEGLCLRCLMRQAMESHTPVLADPTQADSKATRARTTGPVASDMATGDWTPTRTGSEATTDGPGPSRNLTRGTTVRYFGDYEIQNELGRGGMGVVYKARQVSLNRPVALKMIKAGVLADEAELQRFQNEAEAVALLDHAGIVPVYEVGEHDGQRYFSMKLIEGGNLADQLAAMKQNPKAAATLLAETAEAVHHAHMRGILHRDLKPANILIDAEGHPQVTDFGLAKRVVADVEMTQSGAILGTPAYMSPEQASGRRGSITTATDVYGLGAILYALLTGKAPFKGDSVIDTLDAVRSRPPEPPTNLNPNTPSDLETICLKSLEKDPRRRYASAHELATDLQYWLDSRPITARRVSPAERAWLWCKRKPAIAALSAATLLAVIAGTTTTIAVQARANKNLHKANIALDKQRSRAEDRETQAITAVKRFSDAIVEESELKNNPALDALRKRLMKEPLAFFKTLHARLQADRDTHPESLVRLADASVELGYLTNQIGDKQDALTAYRESLAIWEKLVETHPRMMEYRSELARTHTRVADVLADASRTTEARAAYEAANSILRKLANAHPQVSDYRSDLARNQTSLGLLLSDSGRPTDALESYEEARALLEDLATSHPTVTTYKSDLASTYLRLALLEATNQPAKAMESHKVALSILQKLVREKPDDTNNQSELARCHHYMADLLKHIGHPEEAIAAYRTALTMRQKLVDDHPSVIQYQVDLAGSHNNLGILLKDTGQPAEAMQAYEAAHLIRQKLVDAHPRIDWYRFDLASTLNNIGVLFNEIGQPMEAMKAYESSRALHSRLADAYPAIPQYHLALARSHQNIGGNRGRTGRTTEALASYRESRRILQKLVDSDPTNSEYRRSLGLNHVATGDLRRLMGQLSAATKDYEKALPILDQLAREQPDSPDIAMYLSATLHSIALIDLNARRFEEARGRLRQAIEWGKKALTANPRDPRYRSWIVNPLNSLILAAHLSGNDAEVAAAQRELRELEATDPRAMALDSRLKAVIGGEGPRDNAERITLANRAYQKSLHATSARLWTEALQSDPKLADDRQRQPRYNAACAASLAAAGKSKDDPKPDDAAKAQLRTQALGWLKAELSASKKISMIDEPGNKEFVAKTLAHWKQDAELASVRDEAELAKLPEDERKQWQSLWADVEALRKQAQGGMP